MTTAEIITIGTELLLGETVDTNTRFIARALRGLGVNLFRTQTIGDNANRISALMREALSRADFVITTGGLGPTIDDPTREAAAAAAGFFLEYHPELWEKIKARIARYGRTPTENQKRQAYLPQFAIPVENPVGTAPAFIVEMGQKSLVCLPGVPREMETLLEVSIIPYLQTRYDLHEIILLRTLHVSGIGEGVLDDRICDLETLSNPSVGLSAHAGVVSIRIAARARSTEEAKDMLLQIETDLHSRLGEDIFGSDEDTLESVVLASLAARDQTLVVVEYQTNERLKNRLTRVPSAVIVGTETLSSRSRPLIGILQDAVKRYAASTGLGVSCYIEEGQQNIELAVINPKISETRLLTYGGHPASLPQWAVNMALDWLRRITIREE